MSNGLTGVWCYTEPVHITVDMVHYLIHFRFKKKKKKKSKATAQHLYNFGGIFTHLHFHLEGRIILSYSHPHQ